MSDDVTVPERDEGDRTTTDGAGAEAANLFRLGDGVAVEYQAIEGGRIRFTFYADTADMREIGSKDVSPDFYAKPENERGEVKNAILEAVDEHCGDGVSKVVVRGGYEQLCREFENADVVDDEDLRSPIVNRLLAETETVEVHTGDESARFTVELVRDDGATATFTFDQSEWASSDCGAKIREQYLVAHTELIEVTPEEWQTLRDVWNGRIDRTIRDETGEIDEVAHDLVRRLKQRITATEDYEKLRNDTKIALYDPENATRTDQQIREQHGEVDVLWMQASAINEVLEDIPARRRAGSASRRSRRG